MHQPNTDVSSHPTDPAPIEDGVHSSSPIRRVDPAALLVAVVTVGVGPLFEAGEWSWINALVSGLVLLVILCFVIPGRPGLLTLPLTERMPIAFAQSIVIGFVTAVGSALFFQRLPGAAEELNKCGAEPLEGTLEEQWYYGACVASLNDEAATAATNWTIVPGLLVAGLAFAWLSGLLWGKGAGTTTVAASRAASASPAAPAPLESPSEPEHGGSREERPEASERPAD